MRFLIETHHPADIHFWTPVARELQRRGHEVLLLMRDRDVMRQLMERRPDVPFRIISRMKLRNRFPFAEFLVRQYRVASAILSFKPDVVASCMGSYTQTAWLFRKPNLVFTDSEFHSFNHRIAHPFATAIYTPECFEKTLGRKHHKYRGFHELAALAPQRYRRDPAVAKALDPQGKGYVVLRVSAWNTLHDVGNEGIGKALRAVVAQLEAELTVWISPEEDKIDPDLERYRLTLHPDDYHQALAHARLVVTEGASTASEAAVLGTPTLYVNPHALGYIDYLESRYGLVRQCRDAREVPAGIAALMAESADIEGWRKRGEAMFKDHCDVVDYVANEMIDRGSGSRK